MQNKVKNNLQVPVVIYHGVDFCDIFIPDFNITVHGEDYVDTIADSIMKASAIYYYNIERNVEMNLTTTYSQAESLCTKRGSFATFISLIA